MTVDELIQLCVRRSAKETTKSGKWHPCGSRVEKAKRRLYDRLLRGWVEHMWYVR